MSFRSQKSASPSLRPAAFSLQSQLPDIKTTRIEGCLELLPSSVSDARGSFLKLFHSPSFDYLGLNTDWPEEFISQSNVNVIRGMHFQTPPFEHTKLVTCLRGRAMDVLIDLRSKSTTYGQCTSIELSGERWNSVYIPPGIGHGFLALEPETLMHYKVSTVYAPKHDCGILWSSIPFDWPVSNPILSDRDQLFQTLETFSTPFRS